MVTMGVAVVEVSSAMHTNTRCPPVTSTVSPPRKMSIATTVAFSLVLALCFVLPPTLHYSRDMHLYLSSAETISYNTGSTTAGNGTIEKTGFSIASGAVVEPTALAEDAPDDEETATEEADDDPYRRFLTLAGPSTKEMRQWLNQSLVESKGWLQQSHDTTSLSLSSEPSSRRNTVAYRACCGLGHRLARLEDAAHVALLYEATLEVVWSDCGPDTFQQLFGPEPLLLGQSSATLDGHDSTREARYHWTFANDVPSCYGVQGVHRRPDLCDTAIVQGTDQAGPRLYQELLDRYVRRDVVQNFIETHFAGKLSIGMHIRAGNNETGDFTSKNRQIHDMNAFVKLNAERVRVMISPHAGPAVLFVATDTPSYVQAFRDELNGIMPVVELQQMRAAEGTGVLFGEHGAPRPEGETCVEGWHAALQDMMILASTNVVFASTYSSFTRTMPRVMALSRPNRPIPASFCENWKGDEERMQCYLSFQSFNADPPPMKSKRKRTHGP
jgi:hypothetical protein